VKTTRVVLSYQSQNIPLLYFFNNTSLICQYLFVACHNRHDGNIAVTNGRSQLMGAGGERPQEKPDEEKLVRELFEDHPVPSTVTACVVRSVSKCILVNE